MAKVNLMLGTRGTELVIEALELLAKQFEIRMDSENSPDAVADIANDLGMIRQSVEHLKACLI